MAVFRAILIVLVSIVIAFNLALPTYSEVLQNEIPMVSCAGDGVEPHGMCEDDGLARGANAIRKSFPVFLQSLGLLLFWVVISWLLKLVAIVRERLAERRETARLAAQS